MGKFFTLVFALVLFCFFATIYIYPDILKGDDSDKIAGVKWPNDRMATTPHSSKTILLIRYQPVENPKKGNEDREKARIITAKEAIPESFYRVEPNETDIGPVPGTKKSGQAGGGAAKVAKKVFV